MSDRGKDDKDLKNSIDKQDCECEKHVRKSLPDIDFSTFVLSLSSSILIHLGEMPDPETGAKSVSLPMARQTVDLLGLLQDKTRGNLTDDEDRLLTELLYDLRLKYVNVCKEQKGGDP